MQNPQSIHSGDLVAIRRLRWRVIEARSYERGQLLTLAGIGATNAGIRRRFLTPFDEAAGLDASRRPRGVRLRRWRRACRAVLANVCPPGGLRAARTARIDLLPHQLEPALAVIRGLGCRVLLADDVGLGKTIQAGLIVAELRARGAADRILIATPAGLRDQWRAELADRFGIEANVIDQREMRLRVAALPVGLNPWTTIPVAIASIDYIKRPEVLPAVRSCGWDVVVVDEAHGAGRDTDRYRGLAVLAGRASYVLLLTATPHNGDARGFAALCALGAHDDSLLTFRRDRSQVHLGPARRIHRLHIKPGAAERRMYARLTEYAKAVRQEHDAPEAWLALSVLHKRAFSSPRSLALTVSRRLEGLASTAALGQQLTLPLNDDSGDLDNADAAPDCLSPLALTNEDGERQLLEALLKEAETAAAEDTKLAAVRRLVRRIAEPIVIFTEFRDTLLNLRDGLVEPVATLHGGLGREERLAALDDFLAGRVRILLATDAAGEGLNLHHRCRLVVNLELPWNPMRLEQRIGRVDRIGQERRVHAIHLIAAGTGEVRVLEQLRTRIAGARSTIAVPNPIESEEQTIARIVIDGLEAERAAHSTVQESDPVDGLYRLMNLAGDARDECERLKATRALSTDADAVVATTLEAAEPWIARSRHATTRARLGGRILLIAGVDYDDTRGMRCGSAIVPVIFHIAGCNRVGKAAIAALLDATTAEWQSRVREATQSHFENLAAVTHLFAGVRLHRLHLIAAAIPDCRHLLQQGLFDRRAERAYNAERAIADEEADDFTRRFDDAAAAETILPSPPQPLLVLVT